VKIHWDNLAPGDSLPNYGMHIQLYSTDGEITVGHPLRVNGGLLQLTAGTTYKSVCFDYERMEYLRFRYMNDETRFEASYEAAYDDFHARVEAGRDEQVVYESYPYTFYTTIDIPVFTVPLNRTDTIHCYPRNVLHEFTYLVYGVEGVQNVSYSQGAVSGISGAYRMMTESLSDDPSTMLFRRSKALKNGRFPEEFRWTDDSVQYVPVHEYGVIPVFPRWFTPGWGHPEIGWYGDWVIGAFSVFGQALKPDNIISQLTVECFTHADYHYYASWGYWKGEWEDTVSAQMRGALGYWDGCPAHVEKGSVEAQTLWREHNGGFDIIIANDKRLVIPIDMGLQAPVSHWDNRVIPIY
jgi:hypothetical protein